VGETGGRESARVRRTRRFASGNEAVPPSRAACCTAKQGLGGRERAASRCTYPRTTHPCRHYGGVVNASSRQLVEHVLTRRSAAGSAVELERANAAVPRSHRARSVRRIEPIAKKSSSEVGRARSVEQAASPDASTRVFEQRPALGSGDPARIGHGCQKCTRAEASS